MKINCIAIDDEPRALEIIEDYISRIPFLECLGSFRSPIKGFEFLKANKVDLIFLDINMPKLSGIELIKTLSPRPLIILTTAYSEYAVESYGLHVLDYLLKPIEFNRFFMAVNKAIDAGNHTASEPKTMEPGSAYVFVRDGNKLVKIQRDEVLYIEASGNYQSIHKHDGKILSLIKMDELLQLFQSSRIVRVHKSYAVNADKIDSIQNNRIRIGDHIIPIGESYKSGFYSLLKPSDG